MGGPARSGRAAGPRSARRGRTSLGVAGGSQVTGQGRILHGARGAAPGDPARPVSGPTGRPPRAAAWRRPWWVAGAARSRLTPPLRQCHAPVSHHRPRGQPGTQRRGRQRRHGGLGTSVTTETRVASRNISQHKDDIVRDAAGDIRHRRDGVVRGHQSAQRRYRQRRHRGPGTSASGWRRRRRSHHRHRLTQPIGRTTDGEDNCRW